MRPRVSASLLGFVLLAALGCAPPPELRFPHAPDDRRPGIIENARQIDDYGAFTMRLVLWYVDVPEHIPIEDGIRLYHVAYWTTRADGSPVLASGLISIPKTDHVKGIVSYQHGTTSNRHSAPSQGSDEGALLSVVFAGGDYVVTAPDYLGLGDSQEPHPYMITRATVPPAVDLLLAARTLARAFGVDCPPTTYLTGFSQGGHATLALLRALEEENDPAIHVVAAAPVAGAFDLAHIAFPNSLAGRSPSSATYLAYLVSAYARAYHHPIDSVLVEPYASNVPSLFDGEHDDDLLPKSLPTDPRRLFRADFLADVDAERPTWLTDAMTENSLRGWSPKAPVRFYYGSSDKDVSPRESKEAAADFARRGSDARAVCVGGYDHVGSMFHAVPEIRRWFDELAAATPR